MNPLPRSNWQTLEPLLDQALELAPEARSRWLAELSVSSPELAADVEAFLAEEAAADRSGFLTGVRDVSLAGLELGAYRLERQLGQGGMGTVWLAQRADGRFEGQAAVKLLNLALVSATRWTRSNGSSRPSPQRSREGTLIQEAEGSRTLMQTC